MGDDPLYQINHTLGRLESKVDQALAHGERISALEAWKNSVDQKIAWVAGIFSILASLVTLAIKFVYDRLTQGHSP